MSLRHHLRQLAAVAIAAGVVTSCGGDTTRPIPALSVSVAAASPPTWFVDAADGTPKLNCAFRLKAWATGTGTARWGDAVMRFYFGRNRVVPSDSQAFSPEQVQQAWGSTISVSDTPQSSWTAWGTAPFDVEIEFHYVGSAGVAVAPARVRVTCGAAPGTSDTEPTVSALTVTPDAGTLVNGSTLRVAYTASAANGLWATTVKVSGGVSYEKTWPESGTTVTRTLDVTVPTNVVLGVPITVSVIAEDNALVTAARSVMTTAVVIDTVRPRISNSSFGGPYTGPSGQVAVGDVLLVSLGASDNNALGWLVWELGAPANVRDSLRLPAGAATMPVNQQLVVRPEWVGMQTMSVYLTDAAGLKSDVVTTAPGQISFYPLVTHPTSAATTPELSSTVGNHVYDAKRNLLYLAMPDARGVAVYDLATATFRQSITFASDVGPGLDITPSGDSLLVAMPTQKALAIVNLDRPADAPTMLTLSVLDTAGTESVAVTPQPSLVRVAANGKAVIALSHRTAGGDYIVTVDLASGAQAIRSDARATGHFPVQAMGTTPDRSSVVVIGPNCSRLYRSASDDFSACEGPSGIASSSGSVGMDAAGDRFSVGNSAYDLSFTPVTPANGINTQMLAAAISPDGTVLHVSTSQAVSAMRISDGKMLERFNVPLPVRRLIMAPTGQWLVVLGDAGIAAKVDLR